MRPGAATPGARARRGASEFTMNRETIGAKAWFPPSPVGGPADGTRHLGVGSPRPLFGVQHTRTGTLPIEFDAPKAAGVTLQ